MAAINWDQLKTELGEIVTGALGEVVEGAQEDLSRFGEEIAVEMVAAASSGDDAMLEELKAQAKALAEANRLRAVGAGWDGLSSIVTVVTRTLVQAAGAVVV